jgi:hypothetical protein
MPKFHQIMFFYFYKGKKGKIYCYIIKKIKMNWNKIIYIKIVLQSCVINHFIVWFILLNKYCIEKLNGYIEYLINFSSCSQFLLI